MSFNAQQMLEMLNGSQATASASSSLSAIPYNPNDPEATLSAITQRETQRYEQDYKPVEDRAITSLDDMSIIQDAEKRVSDQGSITRSKERASRDASRYGFRRSAAQLANADVDLALGKASGDADILNEARLNQFDRNRSFRNELINVGRGVSEQATQGIGDAASMQNSRDNANRTAKAQYSAQRTQMIGTLGAAALLAFV